jgi:hypothetical protein
MRAGVAGTGLAVLGFVLSAVAPAAAAVAFLLAVVSAFIAFGFGVRGLRDARRARIGSGPAVLGTVLGAAGLVVLLAIVLSALSFRSEIARAVSCAENASGSQQQTKVCTQQFKDSVQDRINGN